MNEASQRRGEKESAHDVLAAEAFAVPAADPVLDHHRSVVLPGDPSGIAEAHDILAAEEFAMPAPRLGGRRTSGAGSRAQKRLGLAAAFLALGGFVLRRGRR